VRTQAGRHSSTRKDSIWLLFQIGVTPSGHKFLITIAEFKSELIYTKGIEVTPDGCDFHPLHIIIIITMWEVVLYFIFWKSLRVIQQDRDVIVARICNNQVKLAVAVKIRNCYRVGISTDREVSRCAKRAITISQ
jgi:hypothetical protein